MFTSNSCVYCMTRYNECGRIGTKWLFFFVYFYWGNVVLWLKRTSTKKLANKISYQIWYKGCLKGKFGRVVQIYEGGSISASGFGPGGSKSAVTPVKDGCAQIKTPITRSKIPTVRREFFRDWILSRRTASMSIRELGGRILPRERSSDMIPRNRSVIQARNAIHSSETIDDAHQQ